MIHMDSLDAELEERLNEYGGMVCGNLDDCLGVLRDAKRLAGKCPLPDGPVAKMAEAERLLSEAEAQISEYVVAFQSGELMTPKEFVARGMKIMGEDER